MAMGVNETLSLFTAFVGTVKNGQMFSLQERSTFNGHSAADVIIGSFNLIIGKAQCFKQAPFKIKILLRFESEALQALFSERVHIEYKSDFKGGSYRSI